MKKWLKKIFKKSDEPYNTIKGCKMKAWVIMEFYKDKGSFVSIDWTYQNKKTLNDMVVKSILLFESEGEAKNYKAATCDRLCDVREVQVKF